MIEINDNWFRAIITTVMGTFLTFASWFGKRQVSRIDDLHEKKVDKETFNDAFKAIRKDFDKVVNELSKVGDKIDRHGDKMDDNIRGVHERIDRFLDK